MAVNWPTLEGTYVPAIPAPEPVTDDDVRAGTLVVLNPDGASGLAEVRKGLVVSYVRVLVDGAGKITGPAPFRVNRYVTVRKVRPPGP